MTSPEQILLFNVTASFNGGSSISGHDRGDNRFSSGRNKSMGISANEQYLGTSTPMRSNIAATSATTSGLESAALTNLSAFRNSSHSSLSTQFDVEDLAWNGCNVTTEEFYDSYFGVQLAVPEWEAILTTFILSVIIILTIIGNILVILSVFTYKPLRIVQNFFIVSLAVADLTVALLVLPFNVAYSIFGRWEFGIHMCKMWLTCDVMCCTSSILNLCAIALDRYWAITDPINYAQKRTVGRVLLLIGGVWILSLVISSPPLVGWNDWPEEFTSATPCELTSNRGYVIYSSLGSFFIPLAIMTIVYVEIYIATRRRLRERAQASKINTIALKASRSKDAETGGGGTVVGGGDGEAQTGLAALGKERVFSYFGLRTCCNKGSEETTTTSMIQTDQDSMSSETNVQHEAMTPAMQQQQQHVIVVAQRRKSRRTKIKDSIKHGKGRARKSTADTSTHDSPPPHEVQHKKDYSGAEQLLLPPTANVERDKESNEISTGSGSDQKSSAHDGDIQEATPAVDEIDERMSLKITPPQSSVGAASTQAALPLQKKSTGVYQFIEEKQKISLSKERRAARTLGIIMGVFVICWLPFFLMYVILPFCETCCPTNKFKNFITWLGYINSGLNPVIYTIFNLDYRRAFKILLGIK